MAAGGFVYGTDVADILNGKQKFDYDFLEHDPDEIAAFARISGYFLHKRRRQLYVHLSRFNRLRH